VSVSGKIAGVLVFLAAAAVAAFTLGHIAHDDIGFSRQAIRTEALLLAALMAGLLAIALFGSWLGKRK
jgi:hypothetical protein